MRHLFAILLSAFYTFQPSQAFVSFNHAQCSSNRFLVDDDNQEVLFGGSDQLDSTVTSSDDSSVFQALKDRQKQLKLGIGKRYITRTQKGFLNVHYEPSDPYDTENVVHRLAEGDIVTSTGPQRGSWIPHDAGGWSIAKFGGFTWLEPIDE